MFASSRSLEPGYFRASRKRAGKPACKRIYGSEINDGANEIDGPRNGAFFNLECLAHAVFIRANILMIRNNRMFIFVIMINPLCALNFRLKAWKFNIEEYITN